MSQFLVCDKIRELQKYAPHLSIVTEQTQPEHRLWYKVVDTRYAAHDHHVIDLGFMCAELENRIDLFIEGVKQGHYTTQRKAEQSDAEATK